MECEPALKEVEAVWEFEASLVDKVIPGLLNKQTKTNPVWGELGWGLMPKRNWYSERLTYICNTCALGIEAKIS